MRAMKDSGIEWIGQIPQEWDTNRIKYVYEIISGNGFKEHLQGNSTGDYPFYKVSDINGVGRNIYHAANYVSKDVVSEYRFSVVPAGALIMSKIGEALKKNHRKITSVDCVVDNNLQALVPIATIDARYFFYQFLCIDMAWFDNGGTIPSVNNQKLLDFRIASPSISVQKRIADYLDSKCNEIDALIAAKEKTNALLKERRQSIIYEAVTKGLNPDAPMKDSGIEWIGQIPEHWTVKKIKYLGTFRNGLTYSPDNVTNEESGTLVLRSSNIQNGNVVFDDNVYVDMDIPEILQVTAGDILICSRNGSRELIGKNAIIPENVKASFGAFMMIFRCGDPKYLYYILNSNVFSYYLGTFLTSTVNQLTAANFGNMKVVYCDSAEEREEIVAHLDQKCEELDAAISTNEATIQKLKEYRQSIIYEAVTGKIEI